MRLTPIIALLGLLAPGCGKSPVKVAEVPTQKKTWIGTYTDASSQGDVVLDLAQSGSDLVGGIVFGSPVETYLPVIGTMRSDSMILAVKTAYPPGPYPPAKFSLRARVLADEGLSGTMVLEDTGLNATLSCRALLRRTLDTDATHDLSSHVTGMTYDGSRLWLGTLFNDYILMDPNGALVDTIVIYHRDAHWTSGVLMYDGSLIWGMYPVTIQWADSSKNVADLLAFTTSGRTPDSLRIGHRPVGLAHDGAHGWSLRERPAALIRFDTAGAVLDSLHLGIPEAVDLAFDGAHFWTSGWYLKLLYEVDLTGQVVSVCDLPDTDTGTNPLGLAVEGSHIWYARDRSGVSTLYRMTVR